MSSVSQIDLMLNIEIWQEQNSGLVRCKLSPEKSYDHILIASAEKLTKKILPIILRSDPSIKRGLMRGKKISWVIEIHGGQVTSKRLNKINPHIIFSTDLESRLYDFQHDGVRWLLEGNNRILADDMGLGKTVQVLIALQKMIFDSNVENVLLLAPNSLTANWLQEMKTWAPNLIAQVVTNKTLRDSVETKKAFMKNNLIIANYSTGEALSEYFAEHQQQLDLLICDEAHKLRKPTSIINNSVQKIKSNRKWLLSGTPLEKDEKDIQTILSIFEPTKFSSYGSVSSLMLRSNLSRVSLRREKTDVLNKLPRMQKIVEEVELGDAQRKNYDALKRDVQNLSPDQRISLVTKLAVAACETINGENAKIKKAVEIILTAQENSEKVLVFSNYNAVLHQAKHTFQQEGIGSIIFTGELDQQERQRALNAFKTNDQLSAILMNAKVGAEGLTLTEANHVIFLNEWWNPSSNRQAEDRVNRIGQSQDIVVYVIRALQTIDIEIAKVIDGKENLEQTFMDELTRHINA